MYCVYCGAPLPEGGKFCPHCGRTAEEADGLAILVERARGGDQGAMAALYEQTCGKVFATVRSMIKNEEDAWDILQDAYIKAFTHLDSFAGEEKFLPWVRQIAANTARDWLKKRRPTLFSDLGGSEEKELPPEERLVEERESALPEQVLDREETARLLREIIDSLPEDQRAVIGMFYYQEMPVKDIAAALGASESAVKSRLLYGRRKIEAKVRELEKSGTKLYGLAPIPFLLWLLRGREVYAAQIPGRVLEGALAGAAQTAGAAAGASASAGGAAVSSAAGGGAASAGTAAASAGTAAAVGGLGAVKIGLLVLTGVALVGAGAFGVSRLARSPEEPPTVVTENPGDPDSDQQAEPSEEEPESDVDLALEAYRTIISQADSYDYGTTAAATGNYQYALIQLQAEDAVPTLLLSQETEDYLCQIRVFQYDPDTGTVRQPPETLVTGVGGGGFRGGVTLGRDGVGLQTTYVSSGTGATEICRAAIRDDTLVMETLWSGRLDQIPGDMSFETIPWQEIGDLSALNSWTAPEAGSGENSGTVSEAPGESTLPEDGDRIVFTGTIGTYTYEEVIELQGCPDPNAPWTDHNATFRLIVLDTPQTMELEGIDGPRSGEVKIIAIFDTEDTAGYDGQHLTFSIDPQNTYWPSDTSMPVGQPTTSDIHVLG